MRKEKCEKALDYQQFLFFFSKRKRNNERNTFFVLFFLFVCLQTAKQFVLRPCRVRLANENLQIRCLAPHEFSLLAIPVSLREF